jgi:TonB family protein
MTAKTVLLGALLIWPAVAGERFAIEIQGGTYPALANQARIEGIVRLRLRIDGTGAVSRAEVLSGHPVLARAAQENVMSWRFSAPCPGQDTNESVIEFTYVFRLEGEVEARPRTSFRYQHPYKVTLTSQSLHWMPHSGRAGR